MTRTPRIVRRQGPGPPNPCRRRSSRLAKSSEHYRSECFELNPLFARSGEATEHPLLVLSDDSMLPETAYQVVHDEAMLDGIVRLNLATFVGTWMDEEASKLYAGAFDKNMITKTNTAPRPPSKTGAGRSRRNYGTLPTRKVPSARRPSVRPKRAC